MTSYPDVDWLDYMAANTAGDIIAREGPDGGGRFYRVTVERVDPTGESR